MLRLMVIAFFSLLISFGAISKSQKVSSLLNHMTQDHLTHSHDSHDHHTHKHSHKHSKKSPGSKKEHTHYYDLSLLAQVFTAEGYPTQALALPTLTGEVSPPTSSSRLLITRYIFAIFRPPIA